VRYVGQVKALTLPVNPKPLTAAHLHKMEASFYREYERQYHYVTHDIPLEIAGARIRGRGQVSALSTADPAEREKLRLPVSNRFISTVASCPQKSTTAAHSRSTRRLGVRR